jgi:hypothetical protein
MNMLSQDVFKEMVKIWVKPMSNFVANHLPIDIILRRDFKGQDNISERKVNQEDEMSLSIQWLKEDFYDNACSVYD